MIKTAALAAARVIGMGNVQALERAGIVLSFRDEHPVSAPELHMPNELAELLARAAAIFDVPIRAIVEQNRIQRVVEARQAVVAVARQTTTLSLCELGRQLGGRDHTTMIYAVGAAEQRAKSDARYAAKLAALQGSI